MFSSNNLTFKKAHRPVLLDIYAVHWLKSWEISISLFSFGEQSQKAISVWDSSKKGFLLFCCTSSSMCTYFGQTDSKLWRAAFAIPAMFFFWLDLSRDTLKAFGKKLPPSLQLTLWFYRSLFEFLCEIEQEEIELLFRD